jgi:hypothetical protein
MTTARERSGAIAALALAAASTGVIVPALRALIEQTGHGTTAAGVFVAAHVAGGVIGATLGTRALRAIGSARRLAIVALLASVVVTLAIVPVDSLALRIGLRFVDGACHLLAITALVAAGTAGPAEQRAARAVSLGLAIVLGVAGGLGLGSRLDQPALALAAAAVLSALAVAPVLSYVRDPAAAAVSAPAPARRPASVASVASLASLGPGLLALCERFSFGGMTVALPFLVPAARVGLVLAAFMIASVTAMIAVRRFGQAWAPRKLAVRSALGFTAALAIAGGVDVLGSPGAAAAWAIAAGGAAGALYACALVLATRSAELADRARGMAAVHAAGSAGHALGALSAGVLALALPGMLVIAVPGIAVIVVAAIGVWLTVPDTARDCPVIGEPAGELPSVIARHKPS